MNDAARRALPAQPTCLQRLATWITGTPRHEALVSAIDDQADRLDARARRSDALGQHYVANAQRTAASELRRILQETS